MIYTYWKFQHGWLVTTDLPTGEYRCMNWPKILSGNEAVYRFAARKNLGKFHYTTSSKDKPEPRVMTTEADVIESYARWAKQELAYAYANAKPKNNLDYICRCHSMIQMDWILPKVPSVIIPTPGGPQCPRDKLKEAFPIGYARGVATRDSTWLTVEYVGQKSSATVTDMLSEGEVVAKIVGVEVKHVRRPPNQAWLAILQTVEDMIGPIKQVKHVMGGTLTGIWL